MKKLNIGILGAGRIGLTHAKNIIAHVENANIVAIADPYMSDKRIEELEELGINLISKDINEVINSHDVDAFIIGTPTSTHIDLIKKIINTNNKPIFCEKPLTLDYKEIKDLLEIVDQNNSFIQMGYNRRFDINFELVRKSIIDKKLGKIYLVSIASYDPEPPSAEYSKSSGMMWTDMNIHDFDMLRFIVREEIEEIFAFGANLVNPDLIGTDVDVTTISVKFKNGVLGNIRASRKSPYGYDQRIEVLGEKARAKIDNVRNNTFKIDTKEGRKIGNPATFFMDRYPEAYKKEIEAFVSSILNKKPPLVSIKDDLEASKIAAACKMSYETGKPIKIKDL